MISNALYARKLENINARDCQVVNVFGKQTEAFLNDNHILGATKGTTIGLEHLGALVGLLVYKIENNHINITRYCTDIQYRVRGGFGKLLKQLKKQERTISTFSDNRFSDGNLYEKLGFTKESEVRPDYWYFRGQANVIHKSNFRKERIRKAYPDVIFGEDDTELQMTQKLGLDRIWDCGKVKWVLTEKK
jgi:hypothetical protein